MQVNLETVGLFIWTTDQFHIAEIYELSHPHGWLARDHNAWIKSLKMIWGLQLMFKAELVFWFAVSLSSPLMSAKKYYE
jgi:hypothetical protein